MLQSPAGGSRMQLAQHLYREGPRSDMGTAMWKLYVNTDDCVSLYDKAITAGCESVSPPSRLDRWPVTMAYVKDFDGYLIELVEYHEGTHWTGFRILGTTNSNAVGRAREKQLLSRPAGSLVRTGARGARVRSDRH